MKQAIIFVLVVIAIVTGAVMLSRKDKQPTDVGSLSNNFYGQETGVVTLTEYADFQCPSCAGFFPIVKQIKEQFKDQIRFELRHFPLVQIHPNAQAAHRSAQASANQGKFWEMHDLLYERQQSWSQSSAPTTVFEQYAQEIGLNMDQYRAEIGSSDISNIINADIEAGKSLNVSGTPTFFIDGKQIEDLTSISSVESFAQLIQDAIDAKTGSDTNSSEVTPANTTEETTPVE